MNTASYISLSALTSKISAAIEDNFAHQSFWVIAEVVNQRFIEKKNYFFFDLVEKDPNSNTVLASIKATAWSGAVTNIRKFEQLTGQPFTDNIQVLLQVSVEFHATYGLKLNLINIDPSFTLGNLERQKQDTLQQLLEKNPGHIHFIDGEYLSYNKTLQPHPVIQRIALISSYNSDGYKDFKHEIENNAYGYKFIIDDYSTQVQGTGMEQQMINKLIEIFTLDIDYDAVVIVRGGGSQLDFLLFNSYALSKAVARFPIPIFTGVGHTSNESIVDLMAYANTKTPTKAAQSIIAHNRAFEETINNLQQNIILKTNQLLVGNQHYLANLSSSINNYATTLIQNNRLHIAITASSLKELTTDKTNTGKTQVAKLNFTLQKTADALLHKQHYQLQTIEAMVKHLDPDEVLRRGYALVLKDGKIIADATSLKPGTEITTRMASADINSTVTSKKQRNG
ncbi:MAG: exodeoxyribonuclease VII large subunit [Ferruginibacter sp.]